MTRPVERVLQQLGRGLVKRAGDGWTARCPAHEDRNPSLSIDEGNDGRALVKCHAGCSTEAILSAVGLELGDLFPEREPDRNGSRRIAATYDYVDEAGELLFEAVRFEPKGFAQRHRDERGEWVWNIRGCRRVLYRLPELRAAIAAGTTPIYVVEGEKDVRALDQVGAVATCNPMGAGKWRDEYAQQLAGAGWVIVVADYDEPGLAHARAVAASLEHAGIETTLAQPAGGKDVSDHLASGRALGELVPLPSEPPAADELPPACHPSRNGAAGAGSGGESGSADTPVTLALDVVTARDLCARPDPDLSDTYLLGPLLRRGERTIVGGATITGDGKTTFALRAIAAAVRGDGFLDWQGRGSLRALIIDLEQSERDLKRALREAGISERDDVDTIRVPDGLALDQLPHHVDAVEGVLEAGAYDVLFVDPFYKAHAGDSNDERQVVDVMRILDGWRERFRFALLMATHSRKRQLGNGGFGIDDLFGSSGFVRGAETIVGIHLVEEGLSKLHFLKDRAGELPARGTKWTLLFDRESGYRRAPEGGSFEKAPPEAIAAYVREQGRRVPASELREHFDVSDDTLRKRREALAELGVRYVSDGKASGYEVATLSLLDTSTPRPAPRDDRGVAGAGSETAWLSQDEADPAHPAVEGARGTESADLQGFPSTPRPAPPYGGTPADRGVPRESTSTQLGVDDPWPEELF